LLYRGKTGQLGFFENPLNPKKYKIEADKMNFMRAFFFLCVSVFLPTHVLAAPYAAISIDAVTGEVLHCENCDTRLHPAAFY